MIGLAVQGQARPRLPVPGPDPGHPDLHHRLELHHHVDRGLVQAAGRAAARPGPRGRPDLLPDASRPPRCATAATSRRVIERDGLLARGQPRGAGRLPAPSSRTGSGVAAITIFAPGGQELAHVADPALAGRAARRAAPRTSVRPGLAGQEITTVHEMRERRPDPGGGAHPRPPTAQVVGAVVVGIHVSQRLEARLRGISQAFQEYKQLKLLKNPIKGIYILLFLLMTLIIVFSATWFGLYLARGITEPIQMLAEGTREVAAGNLNYKVQVRADDEIGILVESFNRMTDDLALVQGAARGGLPRPAGQARRDGAAPPLHRDRAGGGGHRRGLPRRRRPRHHGEPRGRAHARHAAATGPGPARSRWCSAARSTRRSSPSSSGWRGSRGHARARGAPAPRRPGGHPARLRHRAARAGRRVTSGMVLVFDDLTELLKAQRLAAWREVAQRIAHEIKNPLTPIQLSAQRLRRRLAAAATPDEKRLLEEATATIIQEVDGLKQLVDEFSRFARMPALTPEPTDLARLLEGVVALYRESHPALTHPPRLLARPAAARGRPEPAQAGRAQPGRQRGGGGGRPAARSRWRRRGLPESAPRPHRGGRQRPRHRGRGPRTALPARTSRPRPPAWGSACPIVHQIVTDHGGTIARRGQRAARQPLRHRAAGRAPRRGRGRPA